MVTHREGFVYDRRAGRISPWAALFEAEGPAPAARLDRV